MLAVLKSGAAFVPLDPRQPPDRLAGILEDVAAHARADRVGGRGATAAYRRGGVVPGR